MLSNRIALAVVGGACVLAVGTGAYVATRQVAAPTSIVEPQKDASGATSVVADAGRPVQETEAALEPQAHAAANAPAPVASTPVAEASPRTAAPSTAAPKPSRAERAPRSAAREPRLPSRSRVPVASADSPNVARPMPQADTSSSEVGSRERTTTMPAPRTEPVEQLPFPAEGINRRDPEPARAAERQFEELVVAADSVIGLQLDSTLSSETAQVEDRVSARVTRDVSVDGRVAIPAGSRILGAVTIADRGGKMRERARLGVRFHTLVLADGTNVPIQTDTIYREGDSPSSASAAKIGGGAIGGAILGGILGGTKGAIIGGSTGAAGGTAAVMAGGRKPATMTAGSTMTARVLSPVTVTVDHGRH